MKVFDFTHPDFKKHGKAGNEWLKANYNKPVTENEFVSIMRGFPKPKLHASKYRSPSTLKYKYHYLIKNYGLFRVDAKVKK